MVSLLESATDSERTFRESLVSTAARAEIIALIQPFLDRYKKDRNSIFQVIEKAPELHLNPILTQTKSSTNSNENLFEKKGQQFLKRSEVQKFYENGFLGKYKFKNTNDFDLQNIKDEFIKYKNRCQNGIYKDPYNKLPDYVAHLYLSNVVKLLKDNYDTLVQQSLSIFNVKEEELFFEVGIFLIDESRKGINVHQDYAYHILGQTSSELLTSLITYHMAVSDNKTSRLHLFPGTHKEILHNLTTLRYLRNHNIPIAEDLAMYSGCITEYLIKNSRLPYEGLGAEVLKLSHVSRYPQQLYILDKYKNNDVMSYEVDTLPAEYVIFDPALLHANGASSGNIDELIQSLERQISSDNIFRLSLAIRVMHTKDERNHFLWMSAPENIDVVQQFFDDRHNEYNSSSAKSKIKINKKHKQFYTVLCNNKISSPDTPYFSVDEIYDLHLQSGAYTTNKNKNNAFSNVTAFTN